MSWTGTLALNPTARVRKVGEIDPGRTHKDDELAKSL